VGKSQVLAWKTYCCDSNEDIVDSTHLVEDKSRVEPHDGAKGSDDRKRDGNACNSISAGVTAGSHRIEWSSRCGVGDVLVVRQKWKTETRNPSGGFADMQEECDQ
jgi:hypothetical protein